MNQVNQDKYFIVKGTSGLGNRIFAIATAILYCQISKRKLVVDWTDTSYGGSEDFNSFSYFFDCPINHELKVLPESDDIFPPVWQDNLHLTFGGMQQKLKQENIDKNQISCSVGKLDYPQQILVFGNYTHKIALMKKSNCFTGEFAEYQKLNTKQILRKVIGENIKISPHLTAKYEQIIAEKFGNYNIGVHIRYSDMKVPVEEIYELVSKQVKKKPQATIFLATDSQPIMAEFKQKFANVVTAEKWFAPPGQRLHQNWELCQDRLTNGVEALQDIYLLSRCDSLIFSSKSSFGYLASLLKGDEKAVYDINNTLSIKEKINYQLKRYRYSILSVSILLLLVFGILAVFLVH